MKRAFSSAACCEMDMWGLDAHHSAVKKVLKLIIHDHPTGRSCLDMNLFLYSSGSVFSAQCEGLILVKVDLIGSVSERSRSGNE